MLNNLIQSARKGTTAFRSEWRHRQWEKRHAPRLLPFKNIHAGEDCFIIGNGPSLNLMDLRPLNDYHLFGLNKIFLIFERVKLDLSYLVAVNEFVIEQAKDEFMKSDCPVFLEYRSASSNGLSAKHIYPLHHNINDYSFFCGDLADGVRLGVTVTFVAMQIAFYMGFKRVFLIGVDHNFQQQGNPHEVQQMKQADVNHFAPNYFQGHKWQLADLNVSEICYATAKLEFEREGRQIIDATVNGKLHIFDKISYQEALAIAKKKS